MEAGFDFKKFLNYFFRFQYVLTIRDGMIAGWRRGQAKAPEAAAKKKVMRSFREGLVKNVLLLIFIRSFWRIRKWEGAILLAAYAGFMVYLLSAMT